MSPAAPHATCRIPRPPSCVSPTAPYSSYSSIRIETGPRSAPDEPPSTVQSGGAEPNTAPARRLGADAPIARLDALRPARPHLVLDVAGDQGRARGRAAAAVGRGAV